MNQLPNDIATYNRNAWDQQVSRGNRWTVPVTPDQIDEAREGKWEIVLTPTRAVPRPWFPPLAGARVLCLAGGGGQQAPILAAAGADVTVFDNSPKQLEQDQVVARREGLKIDSILGDMRDLAALHDQSFDLVFNPCSVAFIPIVAQVFQEAARVLKPDGRLMCGFVNPLRYIFDERMLEAGQLVVRHPLPYADESHLTEDEILKLKQDDEPFVFSHSLENLITGQLRAGLTLIDFFEDSSPDDRLSQFVPCYFATLSEKSKGSGVFDLPD